MNTPKKAWMRGLGLRICLLAVCSGGTSAETNAERETPYRSPLEGYALCPPAGAQRTVQRIAGVLAEWTRQDPQTGQTIWTLRVYRVNFRDRRPGVREYAQAVRERIQENNGAFVEELSFLDAAGRPAILLAGRTAERTVTDATGMESRLPPTVFQQAWFLRDRGEFLVVDFVAADANLSPQKRNALWKRLLASVELFDPTEFLLAQQEAIKRGSAFLKNLQPRDIQNALPNQPRWFLLRKDGRLAGWLCRRGRVARPNRSAGYELTSWSFLQLPDQPVRLLRQREFADASMTQDSWSARVQFGSGPQATVLSEDGLRQGRLILATFQDGPQQISEQKNLSAGVIDLYLPPLVGSLLPALLDRTQPTAYTFASYDRRINDFQMRTVAIVGPETIEHDGRFVPAVKITDQPAADAEAVEMWVDKQGDILQTRSPDGLVSTRVSEKEALRAFPNALAILAEMNQAFSSSSARRQADGGERKNR